MSFNIRDILFSLGIFSLIIGGLLVLYTQLSLTFISFAPFIPILTGLFFLIIWWQVKDVFCAVRIENYPRYIIENKLLIKYRIIHRHEAMEQNSMSMDELETSECETKLSNSFQEP